MTEMLLYREFQNEAQPSVNGRGHYEELGSIGLESWSGYIQEAYHAKLYWPAVYDDFNRMRRSDPEISIVRHFYSVLARDVSFKWELPEDASTADETINEFLNQVLNDLEGGQRNFISKLTGTVPFMGFGWWEVVPGIRQSAWRPPEGDDWKSKYDDGRIGIRRLAWRDHSSFEKWEMNDKAGQLIGMWQVDPPNERILIPVDRSLHITFGDTDNPEGLSPLEAIWRLERIKYGLEVVQGIGFEHAAGHVKFKVTEELDATAKSTIKQAARSILTAQEGNYFTEIEGKFSGEIMDVNFQAADAILAAIQHYSILKLQVYNMQWVALSATSGSGSFAAMKDSSTMMLRGWNNMMDGFAEQVGEQLWDQLARYNPNLFNQAASKQKLVASQIEKEVALGDMAQLLPVLAETLSMDDEDMIAIRRKLGFLPETLPKSEEDKAGSTAAGQDIITQEKVLNGAQIASAISIVKEYSAGLFPRDVAINMIVNFFNLSRDVAEQLVPQESETGRSADGGCRG